jgi:hypothetical protein
MASAAPHKLILNDILGSSTNCKLFTLCEKATCGIEENQSDRTGKARLQLGSQKAVIGRTVDDYQCELPALMRPVEADLANLNED